MQEQQKSKFRFRQWRGFYVVIFIASLLLTTVFASPAIAQFSTNRATPNIVTDWIRLDGHRLFEIAAPKASISQRQERIENKLEQIRTDYIQQEGDLLPTVTVTQQTNTNLPEIHVNGSYLMTLTQEDASRQGTTPWAMVKQLQKSLPNALKRSQQERQREYLVRYGKIAGGIAIGMVVLSMLIHVVQRTSKRRWATMERLTPQSISSKLSQQQKDNIKAIEQHLLQLAQVGVWLGGSIFILGLFPYTRTLQVTLMSALEVPLIIGAVIVVAYIGTRLSYALINRFAASIAESHWVDSHDSRRLELRINTISDVLRSVARFTWIGIGIIVALGVAGVSLGAVIAGVGILGLIITLASQNLLKGALNSFFFILEDQFAVGDVIVLENLNSLGGLVEDMDLRITRLRDAKGRSISVPNSAITAVANYSYRWARCDLKIPVPYDADINQLLEIMNTVAYQMNEDPEWQEQILEEPQLLGVDDFGERGLIVRLWIKVKPLKQWDVSREYRRRLKLAFDEAETAIPVPQQKIHFNSSLPMKVDMDGKLQPPQSDGKSGSNPPTDRQEESLKAQMEELDEKEESSQRRRKSSPNPRVDLDGDGEDDD